MSYTTLRSSAHVRAICLMPHLPVCSFAPTQLYLDFPGGGFICMNPLHHEERLRQIAREVQRPVLAVDYCKAPEYPYPFALEECFE